MGFGRGVDNMKGWLDERICRAQKYNDENENKQ